MDKTNSRRRWILILLFMIIPTLVTAILIVLVVIAIATFQYYSTYNLRVHGLKGVGVVESVQQTWSTRGGVYANVTMQITPATEVGSTITTDANADSFDATVGGQEITPVNSYEFVPGSDFLVLYDATNHNKVMIVTSLATASSS